jgi:hypothetical protein
VYFACFYSIMTMLCVPLHQVTLTTWLVMHASASSYAHMTCNACLCIKLHSQHCLYYMPLCLVTLTTLLVLHATVSGYTHNIDCTTCHCVWLHLQQFSLQLGRVN